MKTVIITVIQFNYGIVCTDGTWDGMFSLCDEVDKLVEGELEDYYGETSMGIGRQLGYIGEISESTEKRVVELFKSKGFTDEDFSIGTHEEEWDDDEDEE